MPLYEYICTRCDQITDALRSMDQADAPISCDHCNNIKTKRVHSVFATTTSGGAGSEEVRVVQGEADHQPGAVAVSAAHVRGCRADSRDAGHGGGGADGGE